MKLRKTRYQNGESINIPHLSIVHTSEVEVNTEHDIKIKALDVWWIEE